ncbi:hypothetical protein A0J61_05895 [Choanephora cucurbitarum]|uniref:Uncharacterized protein n=1 Tax=Choanephora cucurbitarum TaxID=101091 RepID=A0A1C7NBN6_9FUNG|nr:hypothetical protein A0J61_05895 [Choanephora cucurbitarum]
MCDLNWCPVCDCAIDCHSDSLYCSFSCYQQDLKHHVAKHHPELKQSFLLPRQPITVTPIYSWETNKVETDLPDLASSLTTVSSISIQSSKKSRTNNWLLDDKEQEEACCLYCDNVKNTQQRTLSLHYIPA